jgi:hypothetical protein
MIFSSLFLWTKVMTSQAAVDVLMEKGRFEPQVALSVAEAIDMAMTELQIVTVPILDARLAELKADTRISFAELEKEIEVTNERTKAELVRWVFLAMLGNVALSAGATAILNILQHPH